MSRWEVTIRYPRTGLVRKHIVIADNYNAVREDALHWARRSKRDGEEYQIVQIRPEEKRPPEHIETHPDGAYGMDGGW